MTMPKEIFLRTEHNYDRDKASLDSGLHCKDKTLAQQQFREESDINTIVERFGLTGEIPMAQRQANYGDFTGVFDYQTAMNQVVLARESFMQLPAKVRARFHNDPQELIQFLEDDENRPEAEKLGIVKPREPAPTVETPTPKETLEPKPAT